MVVADFVGGQEVVAAQVGQAADVEVGQTAVFGDLRNIRNSVLRRNSQLAAAPVRTRVVCRWANPARAWLMVFGLKDVGVGRDHLGGFRGLDALLEGAAVGYACQTGPGMNCGSSDIAEASEDLVLLVGVEIFARVERVGMLIETGAVLIWCSMPAIRRQG